MDRGLPGLPLRPGVRVRGPALRRQREFTPEEKKDTVYWEKRRKNNEAAKRSREKRRLNDAALEGQLALLLEENAALRAELWALRHGLGLPPAAAPLPAVLWEAPWPADPRARAAPLPALPGPHGCLWRPCALDACAPGRACCPGTHKWTGLAASPRRPQDPAPPAPKRTDVALPAALPAALFGCPLLDARGGARPERRPFWRLWSAVPPGYQASGPSDVLLTPAAEPTELPPPGAYPGPGGDSEGQPSLPHKLRLKSQTPGRAPPGWAEARGPL
ncbi:NFIL3 like protein [Hyaena hyaena]|uniref:NFIL3 like protein n=1 Tax=Hyaena hyaena TaxID=95912 RepID=UPI0019208DE3|nr:NFIL3 like protein [Hyaena hyaena]